MNYEQDDWARLFPMIEFAYNNIKNASINHTLFKLNCIMTWSRDLNYIHIAYNFQAILQ